MTDIAGRGHAHAPRVDRVRVRLSGLLSAGLSVWVLRLLFLVLAILGLAERVWMVDHSPINSDQAVVGLMARGILHGHFVAFFWGQHYAGLEPYLTSVLFALFGSSDTVLNLTPVVLAVTATVLVYLIGRYYLPRVFAALAALAVWVWPLAILTNSTEEIGYVFACLNCGLLAVLFATRIRCRKSTTVNWAVLGLSMGACVWASPEFLYFMPPCFILVAPTIVRGWRRERQQTVKTVAAALAGTVFGGLPFWWATVTTHFGTITNPNGVPYPGSLSTRISSMFAHAIPIAMGVQEPDSGSWYGGRSLSEAAVFVILSAVVGAVVWAVVRHSPRTVLAVVVFVVAYLVIYPLFPPTALWQGGRYVVFLPYVFVIVAFYPLGLIPWPRLATALCALVVVAIAGATVLEIPAVFSDFAATQLVHAFDVDRSSSAGLAVDLKRDHASRGYAAYWLAYKLNFESDGALEYTPIPTDTLRNRGLFKTVGATPHPSWVVCQPANLAICENVTGTPAVNPLGLTWATLTSWLHHQGIPYTATTLDGFTVVVPSVRITPTILQNAGVLEGLITLSRGRRRPWERERPGRGFTSTFERLTLNLRLNPDDCVRRSS